jgi:hypothetical protein
VVSGAHQHKVGVGVTLHVNLAGVVARTPGPCPLDMAYFASQRLADRYRRAAFRKSASLPERANSILMSLILGALAPT